MNINGSTIHVEGELGLTGLGYVRLYGERIAGSWVSHRGASGHGKFNVDSFTDKRVITLHPPQGRYL